MIYLGKRWWQPALLLFLLVTACRETPAEVFDTPSPEPAEEVSQAAEIVEIVSTPTAAAVSSATPLPMVNYKGVEFAFDEAVLGPLGETFHRPPVPPGAAQVQPEHLEIRLKDVDHNIAPILYVFPVQQYETLSDEAAQEIDDLRDLLVERPVQILSDLPFLPMYHAVESYHSEPNYIDFRNGSGISYLARVDHDHSLATNENFFYTFQGLTDDEQFYVATMVPITDIDAEEREETQQTAQEGEETEHRAKAATSHGNWISVDLGDGRSLIDDMMLSLRVRPDASFPSIKLQDMVAAPGLLLAYDAQTSGAVTVERDPALVEGPDGELSFLGGLPDMLTISFQPDAAGDLGAELQIQPLRDEQGEFFAAIPEWQREEAIVLEQADPGLPQHLLHDGVADEILDIPFQNGRGIRGLTSNTTAATESSSISSAQAYLFQGISDDGRYMIHLHHPLPGAMTQDQALAYLDSLVASLLVSAEASTGSSLPLNAADCENGAEFVEDVSIPDYTVVERGDTFVKIWRVRNSGSCTWTPAYTVNYAQGNPTNWQAMAITEVVPPGEETEVGITVQSPDYPGIYQAWWQMADEDKERFGDQLGLQFEAPRPATDIPGYGVIEGEINYPANGNPAFEIYFQTADGKEQYVMQTEQGWTNYSKSVLAGTYHVFARVYGDTSDSGTGYTEAVICGLHASCSDHSLVEVVVNEGRATRGIDLFDWYAPAGSFPLPDPVVKPTAAPADD